MRQAEKNPEIRNNSSLPLFEQAALPEIEKVPEAQPSLNRAATHTKVSGHDGSNDAAIGQRRIAAQSQGEQANARKTDRLTSHQAAASVSLTNLGRTKERIRKLLKAYGPMTDEQIWVAWGAMDGFFPVSPSGLRTRRSWLVDHGFVEACGTAKTAANRDCTIWRLASRPVGETK